MLQTKTIVLFVVATLSAFCGAQPAAAQDASGEITRVRILLVLDTADKQGATWGLDGDNMREVLEAALRKQNLQGRYTLETFTGGKVTPENILDYYRSLKVAPSEALFFFYSGHGGTHLSRGHFLALHHGRLYRKDLLSAMSTHQPALVVVLTDCCSNLAGGALPTEPPFSVAPLANGGRTFPKAKKIEPAAVGAALLTEGLRGWEPPRPNFQSLLAFARAGTDEPPSQVVPLPGKPGAAGPKAKRDEPPANIPTGVFLRTATGPVPLKDILDKTDGAVVRDLLFRHKGIVDINGCKKGGLSHGTNQWGGSLFTIAFLALQLEKVSAFDTNGDRFVEWNEFFPLLRDGTEKAGKSISKGRIVQIPEAQSLASPLISSRRERQ